MTLGLVDDKEWATWQGEAPARSASFNENYTDSGEPIPVLRDVRPPIPSPMIARRSRRIQSFKCAVNAKHHNNLQEKTQRLCTVFVFPKITWPITWASFEPRRLPPHPHIVTSDRDLWIIPFQPAPVMLCSSN